MGKIKTLIFTLIAVIAINITAKAGVGGEMEKLYRSFGGGANVTKGGAYHTQSGGYYSGSSSTIASHFAL